MRYLIVTDPWEPFYTEWFNPENHFNKEAGMIVFDLLNHIYTTDGKIWNPIPKDHL